MSEPGDMRSVEFVETEDEGGCGVDELRSLVSTVYQYGTCSLNFLLAHVVIATIAHSQNPQTPAGFLPVYNTAKTGIIENGARTSVISPFGSRGKCM